MRIKVIYDLPQVCQLLFLSLLAGIVPRGFLVTAVAIRHFISLAITIFASPEGFPILPLHSAMIPGARTHTLTITTNHMNITWPLYSLTDPIRSPNATPLHPFVSRRADEFPLS
jgi:hypothetical protein